VVLRSELFEFAIFQIRFSLIKVIDVNKDVMKIRDAAGVASYLINNRIHRKLYILYILYIK
jgi:hypothetical protein